MTTRGSRSASRSYPTSAPGSLTLVAILSIFFGAIGVLGALSDMNLVSMVVQGFVLTVGIGLLARQPWARIGGMIVHGISAAVGALLTVMMLLASSQESGFMLFVALFGATTAVSIFSLVVLGSRQVKLYFDGPAIQKRRRAARRRAET